MSLKIGDSLVAIDPCKMSGTGKQCLTVGKSYTITETYHDSILIIDDDNERHTYYLSGDDSWRKWFNNKENVVLKLLKQVDECTD